MFWEKLIFYLFLFCLPFQTRIILCQWGGAFNEWTSAYVYLTDLLLAVLFFMCCCRLRREPSSVELRRDKRFLKRLTLDISRYSVWLILFLIVAFVSIVQARHLGLALYAWFKLLEGAVFFLYLRYNLNRVFRFDGAAWVLLFSGFTQACLAITQYARQSSLGLVWLRESPIGPDIAGTAKFAADGLKLVRAYGGLPHPNILAAFLILALFCCCFLWTKRHWFFRGHCFFAAVFGILLIALGLTFSRTALVCFTGVFFIYCFFLRRRGKVVQPMTISLLLFFLLFCSLAWYEVLARVQISSGEQAISLRALYSEMALIHIAEHPWLGVGAGQFVWQIRQMFNLLAGWLHQPVHNVYLLIAVETGLIGLVCFLLFVWRLAILSYVRRHAAVPVLLSILACFLLISLFDHFFWTIQQGRLMLWLALGLLAGQVCSRSSIG